MFGRVTDFEKIIAEFFGSPYAVAVDSCTHGIELSLRLQGIKQTACPTHTYVSVPMTLKKLDIKWKWQNKSWIEYYFLADTNIADAAVLWRENSYLTGSIMVLSFQFKKHLGLGRGGMILLDDRKDHQKLIRMSYDGRDRSMPWAEQDIAEIGYHYYMTPETANRGIVKFDQIKHLTPKIWSNHDYPDISKMEVFTNVE